HFYVLRGEFTTGGGAGEYEGAMGSTDTLNATAGATLVHDDTNPDVTLNGSRDNTSWIFDFNGSVSQFGFGAELALLDKDALFITSPDFSNITDSGNGGTPIPGLLLQGDSHPWNVTGSYMVNSEWEVAARYENLDNGDNGGPDNKVFSVGANWYR